MSKEQNKFTPREVSFYENANIRELRFKESLASMQFDERQSQEIEESRKNNLEFYSQLKQVIGPLDYLWCLGGGGEGFPTLLSTNLIIVDRASLLNPNSNLIKRKKSVEKIVHGSRKSEAYFLAQQMEYYKMLPDLVRTGFRVEHPDVFLLLLNSLQVIGVDEKKATFRENINGGTFSYQIDGESKQILYIRHEFIGSGIYTPKAREQKLKASATVLDNIAKTIPQNARTGMLIKADWNDTSRFLAPFSPDVIIDADKNTTFFNNVPPNSYRLFEDSNAISPKVGFGYRFPPTIYFKNQEK